MFPDFGERTVKINHCNNVFIVPKLSILQYSQAIKIINEAEAGLKIHSDGVEMRKITNAACDKLWALLQMILPKAILCARDMFAYNDLVELCMHLAFGTYLDDKIKDDAQKYYEPPELPDYQFKAMRILSQFGAYTLAELLNEPASIFFAMSDYAERITADRAIGLIAEGVKAAFGNFDRLAAKRGSQTIPNPNCTQADILLAHRQEIQELTGHYRNTGVQ